MIHLWYGLYPHETKYDFLPLVEEAVLLGTGPSLGGDEMDEALATADQAIAVNEASLLLGASSCPGLGVIWDLDPFRRMVEAEPDLGRWPTMVLGPDIYAMLRESFVDRGWFFLKRQELVAEGCRIGTASMALQLLGQMGVKRVRAWGLDSFFARRRGEDEGDRSMVHLDWIEGARTLAETERSHREFNRVQECMESVIAKFGMEVVEG